MSRFIKTAAAIAVAGAAVVAAAAIAGPLTGLGRTATPKEIAAWDIDVRPDFKGLPKGSGSVSAGQAVWEGKCASCHGTFGESNEVFTPLVGGTTAEDGRSGRVAALVNGRQPQKTTLMKVATVSTLWDYINRAMPWNAPKSLTTDEVYAVTAYLLNMGEIVPDDFVLSDATIAQAQQRMPNRNGMTTNHGMWDIKGKPDVHSVACMKNCPADPAPRSTLPEASRNAHGNLALQTRAFGATRGVDTTRPAPARLGEGTAAPVVAMASTASTAPPAAFQANACLACHGVDSKVVGPSFMSVRAKYKDDPGASVRLVEKIRNGSTGSWGPIPMPAQDHVKDEDLKVLVGWILAPQ
ncbi:c-type cytochrome [Massilia sp. 2TAF26]|uniref:c-type cytochrome n=1 Tax=Massilia sp. 2TAF26 TaxID=3233012 RepID=UPI003F9598E2